MKKIESKDMARALAMATLVGVAATGCAQAVEAPVEGGEGIGTSKTAQSAVIAKIAVGSTGATVTIHAVDDEEIGMLEDMPLGAPSVLDRLVGEQQATPLEVFSALAPKGASVPQLLRRAQERSAKAARVLTLPELANPGSVSTPSYWNHNVSAAECTLDSDGEAFSSFYQSLGWDYHWYNIHPAYKSGGYVGSGTTPYTTTYRAHACNGGKEGNSLAKLPFSVVRQSDGGCEGKVLLDGYLLSKDRRSVFYQSGTPNCRYRSGVEPQGTVGFPMRWSLGITAP